jgi:hypothetical protein
MVVGVGESERGSCSKENVREFQGAAGEGCARLKLPKTSKG